MVIAAGVRIVPLNAARAPIPTAPCTCQNTLVAEAPPTRLMVLEAAGLNAAPNWKMNTALGSPPPSSVNVPVIAMAADAR
jgi:hypothetical protein